MLEKIKSFFKTEPNVEIYYMVKSKPIYYGLCGVKYDKTIVEMNMSCNWDKWETQHTIVSLFKRGYYRVDKETFDKLKGESQ